MNSYIEEDNCFFFVNTKYMYISSSELKTSEFSQVCSTSENYDVFNSRDETFGIHRKKANFLFIFFYTKSSYSSTVKI